MGAELIDMLIVAIETLLPAIHEAWEDYRRRLWHLEYSPGVHSPSFVKFSFGPLIHVRSASPSHEPRRPPSRPPQTATPETRSVSDVFNVKLDTQN